MNEKKGKRDLGRFFIERYEKLVNYFQVNYSALSDMEAEDIVSDVMVDMLEKTALAESVGNISAYVYQSIRNKANDYLRRRKKSVSINDSESDYTADSHTAATIPELRYDMTAELEGSEVRDRLLKALDTLEANQRAVWTATEIDGYSFNELSEEWGVPVGTLLARKHRANAALQKMMRDFQKQ